MRVCVIGGGLAGTLLAWRLAQHPGVDPTVITGTPETSDATGVSGGLVRRFECDAHNADLAARGIAELAGSAVLRQWAQYRETGSLYVLAGPPPAHTTGTVLAAGTVATRFGLGGLPEDCCAVWEPEAGFVSPDRLRRRVLADLTRRGATVVQAAASPVWIDGRPSYRVGGTRVDADVTVIAAGAWTARLAGIAMRTKVIQCGLYIVDGQRPPAFVDETSGLYGRPDGLDRMLLGLPTERWDVAARFSPTEERSVRRTAAARLPGIRLCGLVRRVASVDAYSADGRLRLRPVPGRDRLFTFTGGSGGAAKTALAASADAADELIFERTRA